MIIFTFVAEIGIDRLSQLTSGHRTQGSQKKLVKRIALLIVATC